MAKVDRSARTAEGVAAAKTRRGRRLTWRGRRDVDQPMCASRYQRRRRAAMRSQDRCKILIYRRRRCTAVVAPSRALQIKCVCRSLVARRSCLLDVDGLMLITAPSRKSSMFLGVSGYCTCICLLGVVRRSSFDARDDKREFAMRRHMLRSMALDGRHVLLLIGERITAASRNSGTTARRGSVLT